MAFTASGQSIIVDDGAPSPTTKLDTGAAGLEFAADFEGAADFAADPAARLAQQSCECIAAQASPETTRIETFAGCEGLAGDMASFEASTTPMFSQPSMQPAPAIQRATVSASATRIILIEQRNLISMLSLNPVRSAVEAWSGTE